MKKIILIIVCILCFGCTKEEKYVTINIYENDTTNNNSEEVSDGLTIEENFNDKDNSVNNSKDSSNSETSKVNQIKDWYNKNKDELKNISTEILKNDVDTLNGLVDDAQSWYDDNKDDIKNTVSDWKDAAVEYYDEEKEKITDFFENINN